ncbi:MAG: hypothetical protein Q8O47_00670 [Candidatus Bathyarchaeota archaeon]|nr:hypothetical protein [Candidatus Bathyarchaeota archaeon]
MRLDSVFPENKKIGSILTVAILLLSTLIVAAPPIGAVAPPTVGGDYYFDMGVLDTDTYTLYPWDESSVNIGFSKYGELINPDEPLGLSYKGTDAFANPAVPQWQWNNGWVIDIHWIDQSVLKNVWAYALFSDWTPMGVAGDWQQMQMTPDASDPADTNGGRRTSGWADTDDIKLIYDGPRKSIYLLTTRIYEKSPGEDGSPLVEITIQLVFDKVKKYVMEIKDVKRICDEKILGPLQIEFSQRSEWDLGDTANTNTKTYAEFYENVETKYDKHPFYAPENEEKIVTYDLCQVLNRETDLVGFAAFWPNLISKWVTGTNTLPRIDPQGQEDKLTSLETYDHEVRVPMIGDPANPNAKNINGTMYLLLPYDPVSYPRGEGVWKDTPWVFLKNLQGQWIQLLQGPDWQWVNLMPSEVPSGYSTKAVKLTAPPAITRGKEYLVLYKMKMKGEIRHVATPESCTDPSFFHENKTSPSYGMYQEPAVPYVMAEWDFELTTNNLEASTNQFRCVSVYGLTDLNNAKDPNESTTEGRTFMIDSEVQYQLNEVFNPWDLQDAAEKETFRWVQKGDVATVIELASHVTDMNGNTYQNCHTPIFPAKWGYYCQDSEKVLLIDANGVMEPLLLSRPDHYTASGTTITLNAAAIQSDTGTSLGSWEYYKVLYSTETDETTPALYEGRWEWIVVGETSHASDSIGSAMVSTAWPEWEERQVWMSGLDVEAEAQGPTIPVTMRRFDTGNGKLDYYYDYSGGDLRTALRDDWSTPDGWSGEEIHPYAVSSGNIITIGGPINNLAAYYFNDFTDSLIYTTYGEGFYAPGCWSRTVTGDDLWYSSPTVDDDVGYAIISTYKDLNETIGFLVYGYTAEDTYYASHLLRGGGLEWLEQLQPGATTVIISIDYEDLHPVAYTVEEVLGVFTECTGAFTNFQDAAWEANLACAEDYVIAAAQERCIAHKLVWMEFDAQVHPDP